MPRYARMRAVEVHDVRPGLQRMTLDDGSEAFALTDLCGPAQAGDELLVNVSAVELGLGTGGAHVVHTNLSSPYGGARGEGRVMKARYLAEQLPVVTAEQSGEYADDCVEPAELPSLTGVRVLLCVLHSHALALAAAVHDATGIAPGYVMTDGGALPFVLSDLAAECLESGIIATAVSSGQAFGAPIESVTVASGVAALASRRTTRVIVSPGPGHLGTASSLGFSALDLGGHAGTLDRLGASTALAVRASADDQRARHHGVSHHTRTLANITPPKTAVPVPAGVAVVPSEAAWINSLGDRAISCEPIDIAGALSRTGLAVTSMGRPLEADAHACGWLGAAAAWLAASS